MYSSSSSESSSDESDETCCVKNYGTHAHVLGHHTTCPGLINALFRIIPRFATDEYELFKKLQLAYAWAQQDYGRVHKVEEQLYEELMHLDAERKAKKAELAKNKHGTKESHTFKMLIQEVDVLEDLIYIKMEELSDVSRNARDAFFDAHTDLCACLYRLKEMCGLTPEYVLVEDGAWDVCGCDCQNCKHLPWVMDKDGIGGEEVTAEEERVIAKEVVRMYYTDYYDEDTD